MRFNFILLIFFLSISTQSSANNCANEGDDTKYAECIPCTKEHKLGFVYLNGINNERDKVNDSVTHIESIIKREQEIANINIKDTCTGYTYNQTYGILQDTIEVVGQKLNETNSKFGTQLNDKDIARFIFKRKKLIDLLIKGITKEGGTKVVVLGHVINIIGDLILYMKVKASVSQHESSYTEISNDIKQNFYNSGVPIVLISHSQGNLFANDIYDILANDSDKDVRDYVAQKLANLQIGTPANTVKAKFWDYYTHPDDKIIDDLVNGPLAGFDILDPNIAIYPQEYRSYRTLASTAGINSVLSTVDYISHGFVETYSSETAYGSIVPKWLDPTPVVITTDDDIVLDSYTSLEGDNIKLSEFSENKDFARMSDIFYNKLNDLAKKVVAKQCTLASSGAKAFSDLESLQVYLRSNAIKENLLDSNNQITTISYDINLNNSNLASLKADEYSTVVRYKDGTENLIPFNGISADLNISEDASNIDSFYLMTTRDFTTGQYAHSSCQKFEIPMKTYKNFESKYKVLPYKNILSRVGGNISIERFYISWLNEPTSLVINDVSIDTSTALNRSLIVDSAVDLETKYQFSFVNENTTFELNTIYSLKYSPNFNVDFFLYSGRNPAFNIIADDTNIYDSNATPISPREYDSSLLGVPYFECYNYSYERTYSLNIGMKYKSGVHNTTTDIFYQDDQILQNYSLDCADYAPEGF